MRKIAGVKTPLLPHQQRVVDRIQQEDQPGLVVLHGLGSGKTLTSIAAQDALQLPSQVVAPASLLANYDKERKKHLIGKTQRTQLTSMQDMARKGQSPTAPLLIVDEAHRARDPSTATFQTLKKNTSQKRLFLSGSPFYNHPSDIAPLIDLAADAKVLPYNKDDFTRRYIIDKTVNPGLWDKYIHGATPGVVPMLYDKRAPELQEAFKKWVDYHPGATENFPEVAHKTVEVPMTSNQLRVYDALIGQAPAWVAAKVKRGLPPSKQESTQLNAFLSAARQASNTTSPFVSEGAGEAPKIQEAFKHLQSTLAENPRSKAVVYSNYLDAGVSPYKKLLDENKIPYGEFTGEMPIAQRNKLVQDYNANKIRALLLSSAGGEGLDLKGTRLLQVLEPHWNREKLKQVEGRGARYKSHEGLPPEEQKLLVEQYLATRPQGVGGKIIGKLTGRKPDLSTDQYLDRLSQDKEKLIDQFRALLPKEPEKTAAAEESRTLQSSLKSSIAAHAAYTLPAAVMGAALMRQLESGKRDVVGPMLGGAMGAAISMPIAQFMAENLTNEGRAIARQAVRNPSMENALREEGGKLNWRTMGKSLATRAPSLVLSGIDPKMLGALAGAHAVGALGRGYMDKYRSQIALNELENVRAGVAQRDAQTLSRLKRRVALLEGKVEGDGGKKEPKGRGDW